jgi:hypothetical protein
VLDNTLPSNALAGGYGGTLSMDSNGRTKSFEERHSELLAHITREVPPQAQRRAAYDFAGFAKRHPGILR